jgi:hypothetical protein
MDATVIADGLDVFPDPSCESVDNGVSPDTSITSAPPAATNSTAAAFTYASSKPGAADFQCALDDPDQFVACGTQPQEYTGLAEGAHTFYVFAVDEFGNADQTPATHDWSIDTAAPDTQLDSGPGAGTDAGTATFGFSSPDSDVNGYECSIDGSNFIACASGVTYSGLATGTHQFAVRAIDQAGNVDASPATLAFGVNRTDLPPPTASGAATFTKTPAGNLVLIAGRAVKISKRGYASVALNCSGGRDCAGRVILATSKPVRYSALRRRRIVRLGSAKFSIPATRTRRVRVKISKRKVRLVRKLRRLSTDVIVRDFDRAGRARVSTRTIVLRAPRTRR